MEKKGIVFASLQKQEEFLRNILFKNKVFLKTLRMLKKLGLPDWYIGGGAIPQIAWNYFHKFDLNQGIEDFDIVYFDKNDLTKETEEKREKEIQGRYRDCPVKLEAVNEAKTYLWYEKDFGRKIKPYSCTEEAIFSFPTTASAVGTTIKQDSRIEIFAPHGLTDLLNQTVRANKIQITEEVYEKKCKRWKSVWPKLKIVPWKYSI